MGTYLQYSGTQHIQIMKRKSTLLIALLSALWLTEAHAQQAESPRETPVAVESTINAIDLGLPSGTCWADRNLNAESVESPGSFYAWGDRVTRKYYDLEDYFDKSYARYNHADGLTELAPEDDMATVVYGKGWQTPSREQFDELCRLCSWTSTIRGGVKGCEVTGPNGNSIFLPEPGLYQDDRNPMLAGRNIYYWTRTLDDNSDEKACYFFFQTSTHTDWDGNSVTTVSGDVSSWYRKDCQAIRPVYTKGGMGDDINPDEPASQENVLVVWQKDGARVVFNLEDKPKVIFNGDTVAVESRMVSAEYLYASIDKFTYSTADGQTLVESIMTDNEKPFAFQDGSLTFMPSGKELTVRVFSMNGMVVKEMRTDRFEPSVLPLSSLKAGVYLVNVNGVTYKIRTR